MTWKLLFLILIFNQYWIRFQLHKMMVLSMEWVTTWERLVLNLEQHCAVWTVPCLRKMHGISNDMMCISYPVPCSSYNHVEGAVSGVGMGYSNG